MSGMTYETEKCSHSYLKLFDASFGPTSSKENAIGRLSKICLQFLDKYCIELD